MRDDWMGGLLAFVVAAPVMVICCGGGGILLAAVLGGIGGWLTGLGGVATVVAALGAYLLVRAIRRHSSAGAGDAVDNACCSAPDAAESGPAGNGR